MLTCMGEHKYAANSLMLPRATVRRFAVGSIGTGGFGTLPGLVLVYYMTDSLGISALFAGVIVGLAKLWDVVIDPVIGQFSDASAQRTGTRSRFMLLGAVLLPIFFILTFSVPSSFTGAAAAVWVLASFVGAATAFSLFQVPYIALPAELTADYNERTRLLTWRVVVLTVAILAFGGGGPALRSLAGDNERLGYMLMAVVAGIAFGVAFVVAARVAPKIDFSANTQVTVARQPVVVLTRRAFSEALGLLKANTAFRTLLVTFFAQALATGLMLAGAQYVATWVLGSEAAVTYLFVALIGPALFMAPVWGRISAKIGKEKAFAIASICYTFGAMSLIVLLWNQGPWVYVAVALCGGAYAGMQSLPMAMLPDVIAYSLGRTSDAQPNPQTNGSDLRTGAGSSENEAQGAGIFGGVWTAGETTGLALGTTLMTVLLAVSGYVESVSGQTVTQPDAAITGIVLSFSIVPAICIALSLIALKRYPLRKSDINPQHTAPPTDAQRASATE